MRISDWSSDVCSSDLRHPVQHGRLPDQAAPRRAGPRVPHDPRAGEGGVRAARRAAPQHLHQLAVAARRHAPPAGRAAAALRSEEHTSELQSLMRITYAAFCLNKKTNITQTTQKILIL